MGEVIENRSGKRVQGLKLYDVKAVARFLDVSERRVRQLRDEKVIAEVRPGLYDLIDTNHRYINYLRKRNPESESTVDYNTERALLVRAKRKNEEYELQLKENKLHAAEDIEAVMTDMLVNFKSRLMDGAGTLANFKSAIPAGNHGRGLRYARSKNRHYVGGADWENRRADSKPYRLLYAL